MQRNCLIAAPWCAAALALALAGCQGTLPPPEPPTFKGAEVRVACPPGLGALVAAQSKAWEAGQQARVLVVERAAGAAPPPPDADLWLLRPAELPRHAEALSPLSTELLSGRSSPFNWPGLLPVYREQLTRWGEQVGLAVPLVGEAQVCLYRADLYDSPEHQKRFREFQTAATAGKAARPVFDLRPPASWEELALQAEYFRQHHPSGKPGPSLPPLPADDVRLDRLFYTVAASYARRAIRLDEAEGGPQQRPELFAFHYDLDTGAPRVATPGFVEALRLLQRLQACRPAGAQASPEEALLSGQAVLCLTEAGTALRAQQSPAVRDRVGVCLVPGARRYFTPRGKEVTLREGVNRVPYLGGAGWLMAVPRSARQRDAALDLMTELGGPKRSMQIALAPAFGGGPTRIDQVLRDQWGAFGLSPQRSSDLRDAVARTVYQHGLKNPLLVLRTPDEADARAALVAAVRPALEKGGIDPAEALRGVSRRWAELNRARGELKHAREYRRSLGLLAE